MASVLVTGSSTGIGFYTAEHFARKGHRVFATVRCMDDAEPLQAVAKEEGLSMTVLRLDVTDPSSIEEASHQVLAEGPLDVLINNAGRVLIAPTEECDDADVQALFDVNVFGVVRTIRAFLPSMRGAESGTIVNVSSAVTQVPQPFYGLYAATKHALEALTLGLALEVQAWNIRMVLVEPGNYKTSVLDHAVRAGQFTESSPYWKVRSQTKKLARTSYATLVDEEERAQKETGAPVAVAIHDAVFDEEKKLRYPVGQDAEKIFALQSLNR